MLVVACMIFRCVPVPATHLTASARCGIRAMIVVGGFAHSVATSIVGDRPAALRTDMPCVRPTLPISRAGFRVGWMALLCASVESFRDILKQSFPMYHCHNKNFRGFNPIH
jgi:hypothetical protein